MRRRRRVSDDDLFEYVDKPNRPTVRRRYMKNREKEGSVRCDNPDCVFHTEPLFWQGKPLPLILDHIDGAARNNRLKNMRLLCPNCDAQNTATRGGANRGRIHYNASGYEIHGTTQNTKMMAKAGRLVIVGCDVTTPGPRR